MSTYFEDLEMSTYFEVLGVYRIRLEIRACLAAALPQQPYIPDSARSTTWTPMLRHTFSVCHLGDGACMIDRTAKLHVTSAMPQMMG